MIKKIPINIFTVALVIISISFTATAEENSKQEWVACNSSEECMIVDTGGCLGFQAINKRFESEYRKWASLENMRLDCQKDPKYKPQTVSSFIVACEDKRCLAKLKP